MMSGQGRGWEKLRRLCKDTVLGRVVLEAGSETLRLVGECSVRGQGKQNWARKNINCIVATTETSTNPMGASGAGMDLRRDSNF